jgi:hypothetical protein
MWKDYFSHDLRINSHNILPRSLSTVGNLLLGTPCYLSCCGMRYSRIRELDSWCLVIEEFYFKKKKWITIFLLCGKQWPTRAIYRIDKPSTYTTCVCIEFDQTLWLLLRNLSALKIKIMYTPHISATPVLRVCNNMFFIHPIWSTPTLEKDTKRSFLGINAPSSCNYLSWKFFNCKKEACGYVKKKSIKKMDKHLRYLKQWVLKCSPWKKERRRK